MNARKESRVIKKKLTHLRGRNFIRCLSSLHSRLANRASSLSQMRSVHLALLHDHSQRSSVFSTDTKETTTITAKLSGMVINPG
jgi:hypothetical protein